MTAVMVTPYGYDLRDRNTHDCLTCNDNHGQTGDGLGRGEWPRCTCGWLSGPDMLLTEHIAAMTAEDTP